MKTSIILTCIVLGIGGSALLVLRGKLTDAHQALLTAQTEAADVGIRVDGDGKFAPAPARSRPHPVVTADIASLKNGLLIFAKELESDAGPKDVAEMDARQEAMLDWQRRLTGLEPERIKELIAEINDATDIQDETRQSLLRLMLEALSERYPMATLGVLSNMPGLLKDPGWKTSTAINAVIRGMGKEPEETIRWYKENRESFPEPLRSHMTEKLLGGVGRSDPETAFRLIQELEIPNTGEAVRMVTNPTRNAAERTHALTAFRQYLTTVPDPDKQQKLRFEGNSSLIMNAFNQGFDHGVEWMSHAGFSDKELGEYSSRIYRSFSSPDEAWKWFDWVARNIHDENAVTETLRGQVGDWTRLDHQGAGEWLEKMPEGVAKTAAAEVYTQTIAPYYPEKAAPWLETLPPGEARNRIMQRMVGTWRTSDPAAANAFAKKHGIP